MNPAALGPILYNRKGQLEPPLDRLVQDCLVRLRELLANGRAEHILEHLDVARWDLDNLALVLLVWERLRGLPALGFRLASLL